MLLQFNKVVTKPYKGNYILDTQVASYMGRVLR